MKTMKLLFAMLCSIFVLAGTARAQVPDYSLNYTFTTLPDYPNDDGNPQAASGINDNNVIMTAGGWFYISRNGTWGSSWYGQSYGLNDNGDFIIVPDPGTYPGEGILLENIDGSYAKLPDAPNSAPGKTGYYAINNNGDMVGSDLDNSGVGHWFLYVHASGTYTDLPDDPNAQAGRTYFNGLNNNDEIVGTYEDANNVRHGFLYSDGTFTTFDCPFAAGGGTQITGINDDDEMVGTYLDSSGRTLGFVYDGVWTPLWDPDAMWYVNPLFPNIIPATIPTAINNNSVVTGAYLYFNVDNQSGEWADFVATPQPVAGVCGGDNNGSFEVLPTYSGALCSPGTASAVSGTGPWTWTCQGLFGGSTASCSANLLPPVVNGVCGSSSGQSFPTAPTTNLCSAGTASTVTGSGPWTWTCSGQNGGADAGCLANRLVNGACGSSNGGTFATAPTTNLCSSGLFSGDSYPSPGLYVWTCSGRYGGTNASCSANIKVNGVCGGSNGQSFSTAPTTNLCTSGTASAVTGSGPWGWTCSGVNGGSTASCSANLRPGSGVCGSANGQSFLKAPRSGLCNSGKASRVSGRGPWNWTCSGSGGGATASCLANIEVNGVCGPVNGKTLTGAPATNLCRAGTASAVSGSGPWDWTCSGANGGSTASCSAKVRVTNGACGGSNGKTLTGAPATNLCRAGTASAVSGSGPWDWTCSGANGGSTASCSAIKK